MTNLTWGCELEFGDIPRWVDIPSHLGTWEYYETDIVNQKEPHWGIASDPYGIDPSFGGEINTVPTKTWQEQIIKIRDIIDHFTELGYPPTVSCVQQFHIHVGLDTKTLNDISEIKNLILYCALNQKQFIETTSQFTIDERMSESAVEFLKNDGGRVAPIEMYRDMLSSNSPINCLRQDKTHYDGIHMKRYGVNLRSLLYNKTIEFRSFRASLDSKHLVDCFRICEMFVKQKQLDYTEYTLPPFIYDHDLFVSWEKTKKPKRLENKQRTYLNLGPNIQTTIDFLVPRVTGVTR